jgi:nucleoside-diphosphate-sugar epimerase
MYDFAQKKIVLVGGAGFIGHHLALELAQRGASVHVIDSLQVNNLLSASTDISDPGTRQLYVGMLHERLDLLREANVTLYPQDARDYHALTKLILAIEPQAIVHLAAVSHAGRSNKDPYTTFDHSFRTLENAIDNARYVKAHFIYLSSSMAYGDFQTETVTESHPLEPIGIYGALKVGGEKIVIAYQQVFDLPFTIIRPSALYGPRCISRRVGQLFIEAAMKGEELTIDGEGDERLDFTYIDDLVNGICLAISNPEARNQIFNLTYGSARPVRDLISIMKPYFPKLKVRSVQRDRLMPKRGTLSIAKASKLLGYHPAFTIDEGFKNYVEWYLARAEKAGSPRPAR